MTDDIIRQEINFPRNATVNNFLNALWVIKHIFKLEIVGGRDDFNWIIEGNQSRITNLFIFMQNK